MFIIKNYINYKNKIAICKSVKALIFKKQYQRISIEKFSRIF